MENKLIEKYVPKKYHEAINDFYKDIDGYWIDLKNDYESRSTLCQTIHEYTIADIKKELRTIQKIK